MMGRNSVLATTRTRLEDVGDGAGPGDPREAGGGVARLVDSEFDMQRQEQTQWCWAAVAVSVAAFFDAAADWRQCTLVDAELGQATCCEDGAASVCDRPWYLDLALRRTSHLRDVSEGAAAAQALAAALGNGHPVAARIGWPSGSGHFVVIAGIHGDADEWLVDVLDPAYPSSVQPWDVLTSRYLGTGRWTHTYWTQP